MPLVILDGYVLELGSFLGEHPGGRFSLEHNIGRDISKFFYGGYALENTAKLSPHTHTSDARRAVNKLIIARLENPTRTDLMTASKVQRDANDAGNIKVVQFDNAED